MIFWKISLISFALWLLPVRAIAQIVPDRSLGNETSRIVLDNLGNLPIDRIEGGALRGQNLFHSFQEFNVNSNRGAYFSSSVNIQNIITRVTGNNRSEILGTLGVLGNSNLFLLNPNGIVFGADSKLDVRGAFVGTTGNSFLFDNNQMFSTIDPQIPPLLLVKTPLGVQMGANSGDIVNRSVSARISPPFPLTNVAGIKANTVNLIGSNIDISGGITGNKVSLGAVKTGAVGFNQNLTLNHDRALSWGNITLDRGQIDASGDGAGTIDFRAKNINLNNSQITAYTLGAIDGGAINLKADTIGVERSIISASTFNTGRSGNLSIEATESLTMRGGGLAQFGKVLDRLFFQGLDFVDPNSPKIEQPQDFGTGILALSFGKGDTGDITVTTPRLTLSNGSFLSTLTFVEGRGGNLKIVAPEIALNSSQLNAESQADGNSGNILIQTKNFSAKTGSVAAASTFGRGNGGNVSIVGLEGNTPAHSITFSGQLPGTPLFSGIFSNTFVSGDAGAVDVWARDIALTGGASIASVGPVIPFFGTNSRGNGGNITIRAENSITIDGERGEIGARSANTGNAGRISITAKELNVVNDGFIDSSTVDNNATGSAGAIQINVNTLRLNNQGRITANTRSGTEGNITITADTIELRNNSRITSDGGTSNGGNITINSNILLAFPSQNSDITANARTADGGRVTINASTILGFTNLSRDQIRGRLGLSEQEFLDLGTNPALLLPSSDIAAISQAQATIGGTVTFNTSGLNPAQSIVEMPQDVLDPNNLVVSQACSVAGQNSFVVKGRGGLPENPQDVLHSALLEYRWLPFLNQPPSLTQPLSVPKTQRIADGIIRNDRGQLQLISQRGATFSNLDQPCRR